MQEQAVIAPQIGIPDIQEHSPLYLFHYWQGWVQPRCLLPRQLPGVQGSCCAHCSQTGAAFPAMVEACNRNHLLEASETATFTFGILAVCQSLPVRVLLLRHRLPVGLEHMTHRLSSPILQVAYSVVIIALLGAPAVTFRGKLLMGPHVLGQQRAFTTATAGHWHHPG